MDTKMEIKEEVSSDTFCSQNDSDIFNTNLTADKCEPVTFTYGCDIDVETELKEEATLSDFYSQNEDPLVLVNKYNKDYNMDTKVEIKEACWSESVSTGATSVVEKSKDGMDQDLSLSEPSRFIKRPPEDYNSTQNDSTIPNSVSTVEDTDKGLAKTCSRINTSISRAMEDHEGTSRCDMGVDKKKLIADKEIVTVIDEESPYRSDSSDISWLVESTHNSDVEHSGEDSDSSAARSDSVVPQKYSRSDSTTELPVKWSSQLCFRQMQPFVSSVGVCHDLEVGSKQLEYFSLFVDDEFCDLVAIETNKYARLCQLEKPDSHWRETNLLEIRAYLGVLIYMGMVDLPETRDYFTRNIFCVCPIIEKSMTFRRFQKLSQYFYITDEKAKPKIGEENFDYLCKIQPMLKIIKKFQLYYKPGRDLTVDEAMIGFQGQFHLTQNMPDKPTKWGIKAWEIADSRSGYLLNCKIQLGMKENARSDLLLGEQIVMEMCEDYAGKWHHVYFNSSFTSIKLMQMLLHKKFYACGTVHIGRKNCPKEFCKPKQLKLKRGESLKMQHGDVTAIVWRDYRDIFLLSTNSDPRSDSVVERECGKERKKISIPCPNAVVSYLKGMRGVHLADQRREYYGVGRPTKKWWKYVFQFIINVAVVNSFILYDMTNRPTKTAHGNRLLQFRKNLVCQLIGEFTSRKRTAWQRIAPTVITSPSLFHSTEKIQGRVKTCVECSAKKRKTKSGLGIQTQYKCQQCNIALCKIGCFLEYHQERGAEVKNSVQ